ncbi:MAG TPA: glycosyltransferase family 4 protein [Bryobacteraceae bacterium]|nr:glycosyltransferase family 4 protein [Bryobacteraceae bacterium]
MSAASSRVQQITNFVNILHIDTGTEMRGGQHQVLLLIHALAREGQENLLLGRPGSPLFHTAAAEGIATRAADLSGIWRFSSRFDIVHVHDARAHTAAAIASRTPFVVSRRVAFPVRRGLLSRWKYARAARFLAVSKFAASQLIAAGIPTERIDVVYDAVGPATPAEWSGDAPAVALASRDPGKGRDLIEQASSFTVVPVHFSNDLTRDLRRASMFVYITRSEGLGSAALLAMAMGIPVVASRTGGLAEVFEHGVSGLYTDNDPKAIASAITELSSNRDLATRIIAGGKRRVADLFSIERLVKGTLASYEKALRG